MYVVFEHRMSAYCQMTAVFLNCARVIPAQLPLRLFSKSEIQSKNKNKNTTTKNKFK